MELKHFKFLRYSLRHMHSACIKQFISALSELSAVPYGSIFDLNWILFSCFKRPMARLFDLFDKLYQLQAIMPYPWY